VVAVRRQVDVTDQLTEIGHEATLIGEPGLRQMMYRTRRSSDDLRFTAADDTKRLACKATVSDIGSALVMATLLKAVTLLKATVSDIGSALVMATLTRLPCRILGPHWS